MDGSTIQTGIQYIKSGDKARAQIIFKDLVNQEPNNEIAWLWFAFSVDRIEERRECLYKVLEINPKNANVQKVLAELELQSVSSESNLDHIASTGLKCPSCGSALGRPDHTGLVQCGYCGTTINYKPPVEKVEGKNIERYSELCQAALDEKNYDESIQYANKILEINPENVDAWINKAHATYWLTTQANNRFDEAMGYLVKAENIDRDNPKIKTTRDWLIDSRYNWYVYCGNIADAQVGKIIEKYSLSYDALDGHTEAKKQCQKYVIQSMNYYMLASKCKPNEYNLLIKIRDVAKFGNWITWSNEVRNRIANIQKVEQIQQAVNLRNQLQIQLHEAETKLAKLKKKNGLFKGMKTASTINDIASRKKQIALCEKKINLLRQKMVE
jgi:tetratricopeptide (TPR) repeat protein